MSGEGAATRQHLAAAVVQRLAGAGQPSTDGWPARVLAEGRSADYVLSRSPSGPALNPIDRYLFAVDRTAHRYAQDAIGGRVDDALNFGLLVGYALARTEAGDPTTWLRRALDFVGGPVPGVIPPDAWQTYVEEHRDDLESVRALRETGEEVAARNAATWRAEDAASLPKVPADVLSLLEEYARAMGWGDDPTSRQTVQALWCVLRDRLEPLAILRLQLGIILAAEPA